MQKLPAGGTDDGFDEQPRQGREAERQRDHARARGEPEPADREVGDKGRPEEARLKDAITNARFETAWTALGLRAPGGLFDELLERYAEPHRAYHTARHIEECLSHLDRARSLCERPAEVELALWFHDAIYDPRAGDNELQSAEWASRALAAAGAAPDAIERVHALIMVTRHDAIPSEPDEQLLVDIDLSILGAADARFLEYESQVREEYAWVPEPMFRSGRANILRQFVARPSIYSTAFFREQLEEQARRNIAESLRRLTSA